MHLSLQSLSNNKTWKLYMAFIPLKPTLSWCESLCVHLISCAVLQALEEASCFGMNCQKAKCETFFNSFLHPSPLSFFHILFSLSLLLISLHHLFIFCPSFRMAETVECGKPSNGLMPVQTSCYGTEILFSFSFTSWLPFIFLSLH